MWCACTANVACRNPSVSVLRLIIWRSRKHLNSAKAMYFRHRDAILMRQSGVSFWLLIVVVYYVCYLYAKPGDQNCNYHATVLARLSSTRAINYWPHPIICNYRLGSARDAKRCVDFMWLFSSVSCSFNDYSWMKKRTKSCLDYMIFHLQSQIVNDWHKYSKAD